MPPIIRWILILPAAIAAWYVSLFLGIALYKGVEALCPPGQMESGHCFAPWFLTASKALVAFGAALAATLVMVTCTWIAPAYKRQVAIATFVIGTAVAIIMAWNHEFAAMASAIVAGAIALTILLRRCAPLSLLDKSVERTQSVRA